MCVFLVGTQKKKLQESLTKNPDLKKLLDSSNLEFRYKTKFAPLVSTAVERSFSQYKYLLNERRTNLTEESILFYNIVYFNNFLFK
jgi:hypothetical protein